MPAPLIVVVDDDQVILDLYADALEDESYRVIGCSTQHDAITCIKREQPDLVILDLMLGSSLSGWQIYQAMADDPATATIPIILCTAASAAQLQQPAEIERAPEAILYKPFHLLDLLAAIETVLAS